MAKKEVVETKIYGQTKHKKITYVETNPSTGVGNLWWCREDAKDATSDVLSVLDWFLSRQTSRINKYGRFMKAYGNLPASIAGAGNAGGRGSGRLAALQYWMGERLSFNVTASVIDAVHAKITKNKPLSYFVSDGGTAKAQRICKSRNRFIRGVQYECKTQIKARQVQKHSEIFGDGFLHICPKARKVFQEVVDPSEIWVDDIEAAVTTPSQMFRAKHVSRNSLMEQFPECQDIIKTAAKIEKLDPIVSDHLVDLVTVVEAWHPAHKDDNDNVVPGKHLICVTSGPLTEMQDYEYEDYPFARLTYRQLPSGWWGQGIAEELNSQQIELNKLLRAIQEAIEMGGVFQYWVKTGPFAVDQLNDQIGAIIRSEVKPEKIVQNSVPPEIYAQVNTIIARCYQQSGLNEMAASGTKPPGITAGIAIREWNDLQTERFSQTGQAYEEFFVDVARLSMRVAAEIVKEYGSYETNVIRKACMEKIAWKDLQVEEGEEFVIQGFPVSALPTEPAARLQTVIDYMSAGKIDDETALELLDFPDLGKVTSLDQAMGMWIEEIVEGIVEDGNYVAPDPLMNLQKAAETALKYYAWAMRPETKLPQERIEMLKTWMEEVKNISDKNAAAMQAMAAPPPAAAPTANPIPAPQNPLLPVKVAA